MDNLAINIILYSIFFILSAFFSASEMAYTYVDQLRLKTGTKAKKALFVRAASLAENFTKTNVTIIFCNDVANIGSSAFLTLISFDLLGLSPELWMLILLPIHFFLLLIFAEYLPKAIARRYSYPLALAFAYPTTFFYYLFYIFIKPVELILNHKKMKTKEKVHFSEEQLHEMIDEIKEDGYMKKGEATLVKNAVEYVSTYAYEIMTPRVDIVGFDINDAVDLLKYDTEKLSFSRLIIYDQDLDHIVGFLPVKSFLRAVHSGVNFSLRDLIIEPLYVPRGLFISDLLHDFKKSKIHIAVVKDEFGGTDGLITMEDILEEIVGEIFDETDDYIREVVELGKREFIIDGSMKSEDFFELVDLHEAIDPSYVTVGGWTQKVLGRFAVIGDEFRYKNLKVKVLAVDEFATEKIKVKILRTKRQK